MADVTRGPAPAPFVIDAEGEELLQQAERAIEAAATRRGLTPEEVLDEWVQRLERRRAARLQEVQRLVVAVSGEQGLTSIELLEVLLARAREDG